MKNKQMRSGVLIIKFSFLLIILSTLIFLFSSCATQKLKLYENGKPLKLSEYEKLAQKEYTEGRYDNAIKVYETIIRHYSNNKYEVVWAWYEIGYCYYMLKDYSEAEKAFRKVINEYQDPAAKKLAKQMLDRIVEEKKG